MRGAPSKKLRESMARRRIVSAAITSRRHRCMIPASTSARARRPASASADRPQGPHRERNPRGSSAAESLVPGARRLRGGSRRIRRFRGRPSSSVIAADGRSPAPSTTPTPRYEMLIECGAARS